jgi:N-glycosylase/DNA lyase
MSRSKLIKEILDLKKNKVVLKQIQDKISLFSSFKNKNNCSIFKELCFCLLTANFNAKKSIYIQKEINNGFISYSKSKLNSELKRLGHRFPNVRGNFIIEARKYKDNIKDIIFSIKDNKERREWLVKNIKGLGYKESSHFLRNIGFFNYAILDFHIIDILFDNKIIKSKPKTLTKTDYLYIEKKLDFFCKKLNISQGELDFYLWYLETNNILK